MTKIPTHFLVHHESGLRLNLSRLANFHQHDESNFINFVFPTVASAEGDHRILAIDMEDEDRTHEALEFLKWAVREIQYIPNVIAVNLSEMSINKSFYNPHCENFLCFDGDDGAYDFIDMLYWGVDCVKEDAQRGLFATKCDFVYADLDGRVHRQELGAMNDGERILDHIDWLLMSGEHRDFNVEDFLNPNQPAV